MPYNSTFSITILEVFDDGTLEKLDITTKAKKFVDGINENFGTKFNRWGQTENEISWYDCENNMKGFSKANPGYLFELYREGEESLDFEKMQFFAGNMAKSEGRIAFEDLDHTKLIPGFCEREKGKRFVFNVYRTIMNKVEIPVDVVGDDPENFDVAGYLDDGNAWPKKEDSETIWEELEISFIGRNE